MKSGFLFSLLLTLSIISLNSQESVNTVILLNTEAIRADVKMDGEIEAIHGKEEGYLKGYILEKHPTAINGEEYDQKIEGYKVVYVPSYKVSFSPNHAILNKSIIIELDNVVRELLFDQEKGVILKSPSSGNKLLDTNRKNAVLSYLNIKGISINRILIEKATTQTGNLVELNIVK